MENLFVTTTARDSDKAHVVIVHGYAEHSGRYERIATLFNDHHFATTRFDLRGYGRSPGKPAVVRSLDEYVSDVVAVAASETTPLKPLILFGHSMGGLIALRTTLEKRLQPDALVLSSPALAFFESPFLQNISGTLGKIFPGLPTIPLDRSLISRDDSVVSAALADPNCFQGLIRAGTGGSIVTAARQVNQSLDRLAVPFLVFHGEQDKLVDPQGSKNLFEEASSKDKTIRLYPESVHETLNDLDHEQVEADIVDWLSSRF